MTLTSRHLPENVLIANPKVWPAPTSTARAGYRRLSAYTDVNLGT
jgi:hypothetical protein